MSATMLSIASRTALKRAAAVPKPSLVACSPRTYSSRHGNDPHVLEVEKHRNLTKNQHKTSTTIDDAPGWNEYLASSSEAAVKADRSPHNLDNLQERTVKHIKDRHHDNDSPSANSPATNTDRMVDAEVVEAVYEREEVKGPLRGASGTQFVEEEKVERVSRAASAK